MEVYYATTNKGKVESMKRVLSKYGIELKQAEIELPEPRHDDVKPIAMAKAGYAYEQLKKPVIALDGGLYIHSLKGFPKAFVNLALNTIGVEGILKLVENKKRECEFHACATFMDDKLKKPVAFSATVRGTLAPESRGIEKQDKWSDLWYVFIPEGNDKTLAEMNDEEKAAWDINCRKDSETEKLAKWLVENRK